MSKYVFSTLYVAILFCLSTESSAENYQQFSERHRDGIRATCEIANFLRTDIKHSPESESSFEIIVETSEKIRVVQFIEMEKTILKTLGKVFTTEQLKSAMSFLSDLQYHQISKNIMFVTEKHDDASSLVTIVNVINGVLTCRTILASGQMAQP